MHKPSGSAAEREPACQRELSLPDSVDDWTWKASVRLRSQTLFYFTEGKRPVGPCAGCWVAAEVVLPEP